MTYSKLLGASLFALLSLFITSELFAQQDVIDKRQALMKSNSAATKAIKGAVETKDYATVETKAKDIMGNADKIVEAFPKGSTKGKTKATDAIWEKSDDFKGKAANLRKAANELADAAKSGNAEAVDVKVKALGDACGACHKAYRAEKYSE
jgi:cytochrome c556